MSKYLHIVSTIKSGGITQFVTSLIELNNKFETLHEVAIYSRPIISTNLKFIDISNCRKNPFLAYKTAKKISREYDKIFIHNADYLLTFMFGFLKGSYYLFQHGMALGGGFYLKRLTKKVWYSFIPVWLKGKVIFSNEYAVNKLKKSGIKISSKRVLIVPFGTNIERNPHPKQRVNKGQLTVGSAGRLVLSKRFDQLIATLKDYTGKTKIKLLIAGEGPEEAKLKKLVSKINKNNLEIEFLGQVNSMKDFYDGIDLFIFLGKNESFGLVVIEALFRNVPIIIPVDVGGCLALLQDSQLGFVLKDINKDLLREIHNIEANPEVLNGISSNIQRTNLGYYSIEVTRSLLERNREL